jgi:hypothetical protein
MSVQGQSKAWMTSELFLEWLQKLDARFRREKKHVALIVDNAPCHPRPESPLGNIELVFLPPNTTSKTQPMDQGIIRCMKARYRCRLMEMLLVAMQKKEMLKINVLQALRLIRNTWDSVEPTVIANCYAHCGFKVPTQPTSDVNQEDDDDDLPLATLLAQMKEMGGEVDGTAADYVEGDRTTATTAQLSDDAIIASVKAPAEQDDMQEEEEEEPTAAMCKPPSRA